jgi:hypothetical protein
MPNVIRLARYRSVARRDLPLNIPAGDADLRPVALLLWACSLPRAALTLVHRQTFDVEATLALLCVLFLPLFILRSRNARETARQ